MENRTGNVMVPGENDSGKTAISVEVMRATKQQMTRVFLAMSDVSQIKALYSGEDGERLAETIRQNGNIVYPRRPQDEWHTACARLPESLIFPAMRLS